MGLRDVWVETNVEVIVRAMARVKIRVTEPFDYRNPDSLEEAARTAIEKEKPIVGSRIPVSELPEMRIRITGYMLEDDRGEPDPRTSFKLEELTSVYERLLD